jgi:RES domain
MLDLTAAATRRAMNVTLAELGSEDWRKLQAAGKESFTQAIGRAVVSAGGSGLLARSAAVKRGVNVAIFPGVWGADRVEVVDGAKLEKLGVKTGT